MKNKRVEKQPKADVLPQNFEICENFLLFLLSTYEIWKVLVSLTKKNISNFHISGLFIPKKQVQSEKIPSITRRCRRCRPRIGRYLYLSRLKGRFEISATLRH
jgi:hypothetical protein